MTDYDVIVVGGGPGGSSAARRLVASGFRVVVVDAATFPRDKICAGWITPPVLSSLNLTDRLLKQEGLTVEPILEFDTGLLGDPLLRTTYAAPVSYGIRRREFDRFLLERSGATLATGTRVTAIERSASRWVVNQTFRAPVIIGAGGHFCPVARTIEQADEARRHIVLAQEIEIPLADDAVGRVPARPEFHFCRDLGGYGWIFRKGRHLNVGFGRFSSPGFPAATAAFKAALARRADLPAEALVPWKGHAYLIAPGGRPATSDGCLLVGDAAGLAQAESGEGIRAAVESGLLAADAIVAAGGVYTRERLAGYDTALASRYGHRQSADAASPLATRLKRALAPLAMRSSLFVRHVVLDRWFLRAAMPALALASPASRAHMESA